MAFQLCVLLVKAEEVAIEGRALDDDFSALGQRQDPL